MRYAGLILAVAFCCAAQQITPNNVNPNNKQGNSQKFQLSGANDNGVGALLCNDAGGNTTDKNCVGPPPGGSVSSSTPALNVNPSSGNAVINQTLPFTVTYSPSATFDFSKSDQLVITLSGDALTPLFINAVTGVSYRIKVCQDTVGGHNFVMPSGVTGAMSPGLTASKCSLQRFTATSATTFQAEAPGIINQ